MISSLHEQNTVAWLQFFILTKQLFSLKTLDTVVYDALIDDMALKALETTKMLDMRYIAREILGMRV